MPGRRTKRAPKATSFDGAKKKERMRKSSANFVFDPTGMYSGEIDLLSFKISATAHLRKNVMNLGLGEKVLFSYPQIFANGCKIIINKPIGGIKRVVEIIDGYATDLETGERLLSVKGSPRWAKIKE